MTEHDPRDARMDERLRTAGEQWRAGLPAAGRPPVPVAEAGRRRWLVPVVAAAAAVAAITATTLALGSEHGEDPAPPVTSEPTSTPTTTPTDGAPTASAGPVACAAGDLVPGVPSTGVAAGTVGITVPLTLATDAEPCTIGGYPEVAFLDHGRDLGLSPVHSKAFAPENVRMAPGTTATVIVGWAVHHYCGDLDNDTVRLTLPGGQVVDLPGFGPTSCDPGEQQPQPWIGAVTQK